MTNNGITDVFFDLDHTLWDFERNSALTFQKLFSENKIPIALTAFLEVYIPLNQHYWKLYREEKISKDELRFQRLNESLKAVGYALPPVMIYKLSMEYIASLAEYNHIFPNSIAILNYLQPKYQLHIITNGFEEVQEKKLIKSNLRSYFQVLVNSEMAGVKKPNPIIFEMALNKAKVSASNSIMIGDTLEADILGAQAVGMQAIHFNSNKEPHHQHCPIITDLIEIKTLL